MDSVKEAEEIGDLTTSQKQAIIKLIETKYRDKKFIKKWRSIYLLNLDFPEEKLFQRN